MRSRSIRGGKFSEILLPGLVFACLLFLLVCFVFRGKNKTSLAGVTLATEPLYTVDGLFDGTYQSGWGKWLNDNFYGHTFAVKLHNQIEYSLFRDAPNGLLGKNGYLFDSNDAYLYSSGERAKYAPVEKFEEYAMKIASLQEKLAALGKDFVYVIVPSKSEIYPDYLPWNERWIATRYADIGETGRYQLIAAFQKYGVHYYDTVPDFLEMREREADFDIFANTGHHWTLTAVAMEMNKLFEGIAPMTPHIQYPTVTVNEIADKPYSTDQDRLILQSIWFPAVNLVDPSPKNHYTIPIFTNTKSDAHLYWFGTSAGLEAMDVLYNGVGNRAFDRVMYSHYWTFFSTYDKYGVKREDYTPETPHGETGVMEAVADCDLLIMESGGYGGQVHIEFLNYVLSHLDKLNYRMGDNIMSYDTDDMGVKLESFYAMGDDGGRWTQGENCMVTLRGQLASGESDSVQMEMDMYAFYRPNTADITINGTYLLSLEVSPEFKSYSVTIPADLLRENENRIEIALREETYSPAEAGTGGDERVLGLGILSMRIS